MKKLVKSAEEQFKERLANAGNPSAVTIFGSSEKYYPCHINNKYVIFRHQPDEEYEYDMLCYDDGLDSIYSSDGFLKNICCYWMEQGLPLTKLFEWYSCADRISNEPFSIETFIECSPYPNFDTIEDIYEDVPDAIVITAEQRWNEASKDARLIPSCSGCICKVEDNDEFLAFHINENNSYETMFFPSMKKLREDADFVRYYTNEVLQTHPEDIMYAIEWIGGGEYTMSDVTLWDIKIAYLNAYEKPFDHHIYVDSEEVPDVPEIGKYDNIWNKESEDTEEGITINRTREIARRYVNQNYMVLDFDDGLNLGFYSDVDGHLEIVYVWACASPSLFKFDKPRSELFNSVRFQHSMLDYFSQQRDEEEYCQFFDWIKNPSSEFPFDIWYIVDAICTGFLSPERIEYETLLEEQIIEEASENDESEQNKGVDTTDLFEEYRSLHNKTFERVVNAHKDGLNITLDDIVQLDTLFYNDGSYVLICNLDSATICKNANNEYELELRDGRDTFGGFLKDLTLDTLLSILSKMH